MPTERKQIEASLKEIIASISLWQRAALNRERINIQGLDETVERLCDEAVSLPVDEAMAVQPLLSEMILELEKLHDALNYLLRPDAADS